MIPFQNQEQSKKMDGPDPKRKKKSDKAKETYERNGGFSQKHVRIQESLQEKRNQTMKKKQQISID